MKTRHSMPAPAACAATELAKLPVEAQAIASKPNSRARAMATETTRSLKDHVGFTVSFFSQRLSRPSTLPRRSALISGV